MLVTKAKAGHRYCPFKFSSGTRSRFCSNEHCMAWRLVNIQKENREFSGYCGLVGKPPENDVEVNFQ
jgi:hypothetical protein